MNQLGQHYLGKYHCKSPIFDIYIYINATGITASKKPSNHPEEIVLSYCEGNSTAATVTQASGLINSSKSNTNEDTSCIFPRVVDFHILA